MNTVVRATLVVGVLLAAGGCSSPRPRPGPAADEGPADPPIATHETTPPPPKCARGSRDLGVHRGYVDGLEEAVLLCAVHGLWSSSAESQPGNRLHLPGARGEAIVHARISAGVVGLHRLAARRGVDLQVSSSFRTDRHQRQLCRDSRACRSGDYTFVAPPGYSNHQMGLAVDFTGTWATGTKSCTQARAVDPTSRVWRFLNRHAGRFGLRQYAAESWHWDAVAHPSRCDPPARS